MSAEYLKINPLGKVPTFQGEDGFVLSECIAIAIYREFPKLDTSLQLGLLWVLQQIPCRVKYLPLNFRIAILCLSYHIPFFLSLRL